MLPLKVRLLTTYPSTSKITIQKGLVDFSASRKKESLLATPGKAWIEA